MVWFGKETLLAITLQSITSIQPQRGRKNVNRKTTAASACQSLRKTNIFCLQTVKAGIYFRKLMGGYNYAPSSACLPGLFRHQFLIAGPDKAHCWLTYRTNTLPQTHTHVHKNVHPVRKTPYNVSLFCWFCFTFPWPSRESHANRWFIIWTVREKEGRGREKFLRTLSFASSWGEAGFDPAISSALFTWSR